MTSLPISNIAHFGELDWTFFFLIDEIHEICVENIHKDKVRVKMQPFMKKNQENVPFSYYLLK